jgi:hypothetical protein
LQFVQLLLLSPAIFSETGLEVEGRQPMMSSTVLKRLRASNADFVVIELFNAGCLMIEDVVCSKVCDVILPLLIRLSRGLIRQEQTNKYEIPCGED